MIIKKFYKYINESKFSNKNRNKIMIKKIKDSEFIEIMKNSSKWISKNNSEVIGLGRSKFKISGHSRENKISTIDFYKEKDINECPYCKDNNFIKFGSYNGIQRYKCKHCNKTFSKTTTSLWKYSKKSSALWNEFVYLVVRKYTLRYCGKQLGISVMTAFYWRHKILYALGKGLFNKDIAGDIIYLCSMNIIQNDKGNYKSKKVLPNVSRHDYYAYSILYRDFTAAVAVKNLNNQFMIKTIKTIDARGYDIDDFNNKIYSYIDSKAYMKPYYGSQIRKYSINHNIKLPKNIKREKGFVCKDKKRCFFTDSVDDDIEFENIYIELYGWLDRYNGVASKYLQNYFYLFGFMYMNKDININNMCFELLNRDAFITTNDIKKLSIV